MRIALARHRVRLPPSGTPEDARQDPRAAGQGAWDSHDRGVKSVARTLCDAGLDVVCTGLYRSPDEVVGAAVQEDVGVQGIDGFSGAQMTILPKVILRGPNLRLRPDGREIALPERRHRGRVWRGHAVLAGRLLHRSL